MEKKVIPMANKERIIQIVVAALVVASALALFGWLSPAAGAEKSGRDFHWWGQRDGRTITIEQKDGTLEILQDGEAVPEDRIERRGDSLLVLDEEGNPVYQVVLDAEGDAVFARSLRHDLEGLVTRRSLRLGIVVGGVDQALAAQLGLDEGEGILVRRVEKDSAAEKAGLRAYDVIVAIDGEKIDRSDALRRHLREMEEGESLELTVLRRGERIRVEARPTLEEIFAPEAPMPPEVMIYDLRKGSEFWRERLEDLPAPPPVRFFERDDDEDFAVVAPPSPEGFAFREAESAERLERLEERLARLEKMLQELLAKQKD